MMLTELAKVARAAGLTVVEVDGWKSRGHGEMGAVNGVVCHHTAGPANGAMPSLNVVVHGRADLPGPLCNFALGRDGTVYVVAAGLAYHAGAVRDPRWSNGHMIGIEAEGTGHDAWPAVQMDAYARLCRALSDHYGFPVSAVLGHKEVCAPPGRKVDPNFDMPTFRARVREVKPMLKTRGKQADIAEAALTKAHANAVKNGKTRRAAKFAAALKAVRSVKPHPKRK